jgi:hypothetical protein
MRRRRYLHRSRSVMSNASGARSRKRSRNSPPPPSLGDRIQTLMLDHPADAQFLASVVAALYESHRVKP